jgi:DNA polymerase/3'-5' exonuclease PolX
MNTLNSRRNGVKDGGGLKPRFSNREATEAAQEITAALRGACRHLEIAGSLRRQKPHVGDIEILHVPIFEDRRIELFPESVNLADEAIERLLQKGVIGKRPLAKGKTAWGQYNKLALHRQSGIPVDLFRASEENWWNYLVCRTGPASSNARIASEAIKRGWRWNPYSIGFSNQAGETHQVHSEAEVFEFVGLPYLPPARR